MKQIFIFFYFSIYFLNVNSQIVEIPDINFKNALLNSNVVDTTGNGLGDSIADFNMDGEIQVSEAEAVVGLIISYYEIISLEGIQSFTNLEVLKSRGNFLETIDLSQNNELTWLHLSTNPLIDIDVSNNPNLEKLWIYNNNLSSLDVSQNPNLTSLRCYTNDLTYLNIANSNNDILSNFLAYENSNLFCIQVDDVDYANNQKIWDIDDWAVYNEDCSFGIEELLEKVFELYPNPTTGTLHIDSNFQEIKQLKVFNSQGKEVKVKFDIESIDVSKLTSGVYFTQIVINKGVVIKRFIKQ